MKKMSLRENQSIFALNLANLIIHANQIGQPVFIVELYRDPAYQQQLFRTGKSNTTQSKHCLGLAADLYLLSDIQDDGIVNAKLEDYRELGEFWETLSPACTWGGKWNWKADLCHFSCDSLNPERKL